MAPGTAKKKKPAPKKTSLSDREYVNQSPAQEDIAYLKDKEGNITAEYLPIEVVERDLDRWAWSTQNFNWKEFRDKRGDLWIGASLELVIPWIDNSHGLKIERRLVGCCNFSIGSYAPNSHFVATAKSECVKNAASDLGRRFGRGLNAMVITSQVQSFSEVPLEAIKNSNPKRKPDKDMQERIRKATEEGDTSALAVYANIYEIKTEENES